ncbi:hypothetical protein V8C26DRAFT_224183 [Trichoderma gracile]
MAFTVQLVQICCVFSAMWLVGCHGNLPCERQKTQSAPLGGFLSCSISFLGLRVLDWSHSSSWLRHLNWFRGEACPPSSMLCRQSHIAAQPLHLSIGPLIGQRAA